MPFQALQKQMSIEPSIEAIDSANDKVIIFALGKCSYCGTMRFLFVNRNGKSRCAICDAAANAATK